MITDKRNIRILLDMDGVLTDFVRQALTWHDLANIECPKGEYDIVKVIQKHKPHISKKAFWCSLNELFWSSMPWMSDGRDILASLESQGYKICLLTSPTLDASSLAGKFEWINLHAPEYKRKFLIGAAKEFCANHNSVLIDDNDDNCFKFREAGGEAILVPRPWNKLHDALRKDDTVINYINICLESMFE